MKEIIKGIMIDSSNFIAFASFLISTAALLVTVIYNSISHKQYIESLNPTLSFKLIQNDGKLYLSITNTGQSSAKGIRVSIEELCNNGDEDNLRLDKLFYNEFDLFPQETVQGIVGFSGENMGQDIFPVVKLDISYTKSNNNKKEAYQRTVTFTRTYENNIDLSKLENKLNSISYSNNRVANYLEGRTLYVFDEINTHPNNSFFKDMKDALNNIER